MYTCDDCTDLLLDYLYGLLEPADAQSLREHLAGCPACQASLAEAEAQQNLLNRAAQVYRKVPAFVAPPDEEAIPTAPGGPPTATIPMPGRPVRRPSRRWAWAAVAAAVLLSAGGLYAYTRYEDGLQDRAQAVAAARQRVEEVQAQFAGVGREYEQEAAALPARVQARQLQMQVFGPAVYRRDAPSRYHVLTKNLDGQPVPADLTVRATDGAGRKVLFQQAAVSPGETVLEVPADLRPEAGPGLRLEVEARSTAAREELYQDLAVEGPAYLTQLTLNKSAYHVGEVVFFRSLTLQRFSLRPPDRAFRLQFALVDSLGKQVKKLEVESRPDGIGGGELPLTGDLNEGDYTLRVSPAEGSAAFPPQEHRLLVQRDPGVELEFDRPQYRPGETMNVQVRGRQLENGANAIANQPLTATIRAPGAAMPAPVQTRADSHGYAAFQARVPDKAAAGNATLELQVHDGKRNEKLQQQVQISPARRTVEFFPEGGDLAAGVPNRVYFRVTTPPGEPADVEGRILDRQGRAVAQVKTAPAFQPGDRQRLGVFVLTPQAGESYRLQITAPQGVREEPALPEPFAGAVALSVPEGVGREGDPVRVVLHTTGTGRSLVVLASCRGHVVDEQFVTARPGMTEVSLKPGPGSRGVLRVTVYEPQRAELVPLAERLVYQAPAHRLQLSWSPQDKGADRPYRPGEHVKWALKADTESGAADRAWLGVVTVDERVLQGADNPAGGGPPAFFYLGSAVPAAENLEDANFLLGDGPNAQQGLDLFLGTQGWRRFVRREGEPVLAQAWPGAKGDPAAGAAQAPAVFNADNGNAVRQRYEAELAGRQAALRATMLHTRAELLEERARRTGEVSRAELALSEYEQTPREQLRLAAGLLAVVLLAGGALSLLVGLVRALRGATSPTPAFATAAATLAVCALLYALTGTLRVEDGRDQQEKAGRDQLAQADWGFPAQPHNARRLAPRQDGAPVGTFAEARVSEELPREGRAADRVDRDQTAGMVARASESKAQNRGTFRQGSPGLAREALRDQAKEAGQMGLRFAEASRRYEAQNAAFGAGGRGVTPPAAGTGAPAQGAVAKGGVAGPKTTETLNASSYLARVYTAQGREFQDTLLWHPALTAVHGQAEVEFDLPDAVTTYRVFLSGHDPSGRLGFTQGRLEVRPAGAK